LSSSSSDPCGATAEPVDPNENVTTTTDGVMTHSVKAKILATLAENPANSVAATSSASTELRTDESSPVAAMQQQVSMMTKELADIRATFEDLVLFRPALYALAERTSGSKTNANPQPDLGISKTLESATGPSKILDGATPLDPASMHLCGPHTNSGSQL
jgi:hypothetical protein